VHARHSGHGVRIGDYDLIMLTKGVRTTTKLES
jgi:hypothetical protein